MSNFDRFQNRTKISATLEMYTALSVGSRVSLEPTGTDLPVVKGADGLPFIPGSSMKGVVRSQTERVLRAVNKPPDFWACDPFGEPCVSTNKKDELLRQSRQDEKGFSQLVWQQSCTACRLFGSPWFSSHFAFRDASLLNSNDLPILTQIRDGVGIDRDLGAARTGFKYDFEVVVPGAQFGMEILAENVEDWEIGLLLAVLRSWQEGSLPIGGKSTRGPGWGKLRNLSVHQVEQQNLLEYLLQGQMTAVETERFIHAFQDKAGLNGG